jgi:cation diffusion facilitator family transporter
MKSQKSPSKVRTKVVESAARGARATLAAILVSAVLAATKIIAGITGYSYALVADGVESMLDIMSALVVLGSLRISAEPPNERYPYGYGRAETLGAFVIATGLLVAAIGIAIHSVREIMTPHHMPARWTLVVLLLVVITKELLFRYLSRTAGEIESQTVGTDAWHHRSDALTSAAAFIGISIGLIGGKGYEAADDWAALFACGIIAFNGTRLFLGALRDVMDAAPPAALEERIRDIASAVDGVEQIDKCLARRSGFGYFVDLHIEVDGRLPVRDGHEIAHRVKDALVGSELKVLDATIHVEPYPNPYK